jgi:hypothetical protein
VPGDSGSAADRRVSAGRGRRGGLLGRSARVSTSSAGFSVCGHRAVVGVRAGEPAAGIAANANGLPCVAAGTFLSGTTFLALMVAGAGALIAPIDADLPRAALAWTASSPLLLALLAFGGQLSRVDGGMLVVWSLIYRARDRARRPRDLQRRQGAKGARVVAALAGHQGQGSGRSGRRRPVPCRFGTAGEVSRDDERAAPLSRSDGLARASQRTSSGPGVPTWLPESTNTGSLVETSIAAALLLAVGVNLANGRAGRPVGGARVLHRPGRGTAAVASVGLTPCVPMHKSGGPPSARPVFCSLRKR